MGPTFPESAIIVGGSLAGLRCASALRRGGYTGSLTMIDGAGSRAYDRPPLSKQFLRGEWDQDRLSLLSDEQMKGLDLNWLCEPAVGLDVEEGIVRVADGEVTADAIVIATGARPRLLPGTPDAAGVHVLRTLADATKLRHELAGDSKRVVVIGAGFIGCEVAASAIDRGHEVTLIEAGAVPMERGLGQRIGTLCGSLHTDHGVDLRLNTMVRAVRTVKRTQGMRVTGVTLSTGETVSADVLVVGIGVVPNVEWLEGSGLELNDGVVCNSYCEAAPGVFAAGDVARWHNNTFDQSMRVEHWDNAVEQGIYVAKRILGEQAPYAPVPWFWSDQFEYKLQLAGHPHADDRVEIVIGDPDDKRFVAIYGRGDRLTAVFGLNRPRHVMKYRRLIAAGASWQDAIDHAKAEAERDG